MRLTVGDTLLLSAAVTPAGAGTSLSWASSNKSIATVSSYGRVTAIAPGFVRITATARDGTGVFGSCRVKVFADPAAIAITSVEATGGTSLKVSWTPILGVAGYELWWGESSTGTFKLTKDTTATTFTKTYLTPGTRYFFKVRAYNLIGRMKQFFPFSPVKAGVPLAKAALTSAAATAKGSVKLTWNAVPGASGYQILLGIAPAGPYAAVKTTAATTCTLTGLNPGTMYYFKVQAYKRYYTTNYYGPASGYKSVKTPLK